MRPITFTSGLCGDIPSDWSSASERALYSTPCVRQADHAGLTHQNASGLAWLARLTAPVLPAVLVVGPVSTADQRSDINAFAWDVSDQLGREAVIATSTDFDVTAYEAIVVCDDPMTDWTSTVLYVEAIGTGCRVVEQQHPRDSRRCDACRKYLTVDAAGARNTDGEHVCGSCSDENRCNWCGENDDLTPYVSSSGWIPFCRPCARAARREEKQRAYEAREQKRYRRTASVA